MPDSRLGDHIDEDELVTVIYSELDRAVDYASTALKENRRNAWNYYLNRTRGDEIEGRSTVQDTSVRDTVHALLATIMPAYATDSVFTFEPEGPDDIDQAEAEAHALNNLFTETNKGYLELYNAVQDALLFRNGIIKVWIDEVEEVSHRKFDADPAAVLVQAPKDEDWEHTGEDDEGVQEFTVKRMVQKLRIEGVEGAYFYTDPNQQDNDLQAASFLAELVYYSRSDLVQMGVPKVVVAELPASPDKGTTTGVGETNTDIIAKFIDGIADIHGFSTADREEIECHWIHMQLDRDSDGISERWRFLVAHRQILVEDPVDYFPYASGTAWPVPHRWSGQSVYDLARITQDERTNARRQLADNLNVANNQRPIYDPNETSPEDVNTGAPGRGIRSKNPANVAFMPVSDVVSNSVQFLQYMDKVRSEQTGSALEMQSAEGQLVREASGISVDMQLAPREQMAAMVSRNIAETLVRQMVLLMHTTLRNEWREPIMYRKSGQWQETNPAEWRPRTRMNVAIGLSPGERRRQVMALQYINSMQMQMISGGTANITTNWEGVHAALMRFMQAAELDGYEDYFLDPASPESQQAMQNAAQQAQQQGQMQQQMQQLQVMIEEQDRKLDKYKHDTELQYKYWSDLLDANTEQDKLDEQAAESARTNGADGGTGNSQST